MVVMWWRLMRLYTHGDWVCACRLGITRWSNATHWWEKRPAFHLVSTFRSFGASPHVSHNRSVRQIGPGFIWDVCARITRISLKLRWLISNFIGSVEKSKLEKCPCFFFFFLLCVHCEKKKRLEMELSHNWQTTKKRIKRTDANTQHIDARNAHSHTHTKQTQNFDPTFIFHVPCPGFSERISRHQLSRLSKPPTHLTCSLKPQSAKQHHDPSRTESHNALF